MGFVEVFLRQEKKYFPKDLSKKTTFCINQILIINEKKYFSIYTSEIEIKKIKEQSIKRNRKESEY